MKKLFRLLAVASLATVLLIAQNPNGNGIGNAWGYGNGNGANDGVVVIPDSSVENPGDAGHKAHTNHLIFLRGLGRQSYLSGLTPGNIKTAYNLPGDNLPPMTGKGIIAIVDAYHYPNAYNDLKVFNGRFGLGDFPQCGTGGPSGAACFWQVYADSKGQKTDKAPPVNCGWNQEAALDIQWAHAMAPNASIVLVEAQSNSNADLFGAVTYATSVVSTMGTGVGQVSMSWGGSEYAGETAWDSVFLQPQSSLPLPNVIFIASSGDTGGKTIYPAASPYVIAAGGTTLNMTNTGFVSETGWSGSGGGASSYEPVPDYQSSIVSIANIVGKKRGVPDFSFDADPTTGVLVYGPTCRGTNTAWLIFGGTSVSAPALAGIINSAAAQNGFAGSTNAELWRIYGLLGNSAEYRDIQSGKAGNFTAVSGWDFVTGIGTPLTLAGK